MIKYTWHVLFHDVGDVNDTELTISTTKEEFDKFVASTMTESWREIKAIWHEDFIEI